LPVGACHFVALSEGKFVSVVEVREGAGAVTAGDS
jgi:hypothetical protein